MLGVTAAKAKELGMRMDLTLGSGWPYGGPMFTAADGAKSLQTQMVTVPAGQRGAGRRVGRRLRRLRGRGGSRGRAGAEAAGHGGGGGGGDLGDSRKCRWQWRAEPAGFTGGEVVFLNCGAGVGR